MLDVNADSSVSFSAAAIVVSALALLVALGFMFRGHVHF